MSIKNLNDKQRKVYEACRNGWFVGGEYRAKFDNHEKRFFADSPSWLFREVDDWFASQESQRLEHSGQLPRIVPKRLGSRERLLFL